MTKMDTNVETAQYMVCRCIKVVYHFMVNIPVDKPNEVGFHVPYMEKPVKVFKNLEDARAFMHEENERLHNPPKNADGSFSIDILPNATDYVVIDLENRKTIQE